MGASVTVDSNGAAEFRRAIRAAARTHANRTEAVAAETRVHSAAAVVAAATAALEWILGAHLVSRVPMPYENGAGVTRLSSVPRLWRNLPEIARAIGTGLARPSIRGWCISSPIWTPGDGPWAPIRDGLCRPS
jgi:hypothetical protein